MSDTDVLDAPPGGAEDTCSHCGSPQKDSKLGWCRRCGFVPRLGTFVELDPWDKEPDPDAAPAPQVKKTDLIKMVPPWGWKLAAISLAIVLFSITGRLVTPADSSARMYWALIQLGVGLLVFFVGHLSCYVLVIMETDGFNLVDLLIKPWAIWMRAIQDMPASFRQIALTLGGWLAATMATLVVGGIPYEKLFEGTPTARAKINLVQAITDAARQADASQDGLDKAIEDFAGKALDKADADKKEDVERRRTADCVIAGFVPVGEDFSELVLVSQVEGRVQYVGSVSDDIPPEVRKDLNRRLREIERPRPFVPCGVSGAVWVNPQLMCRIKFKDWSSSKRMITPHFDSMLAEISTK